MTECYTEDGIMVCYCGKCEPKNYPLPKDFTTLIGALQDKK